MFSRPKVHSAIRTVVLFYVGGLLTALGCGTTALCILHIVRFSLPTLRIEVHIPPS